MSQIDLNSSRTTSGLNRSPSAFDTDDLGTVDDRKIANPKFYQQLIEKLDPKLLNLDELREMDGFAVKKYPDRIYLGQVSHGKREGSGILQYENGRIYEGNWCQNLREAFGRECYPNGNVYEGEFHVGKAHGKGLYKWANGESYDGEWKDGLKQGSGKWVGLQGDSYEGDWKKSKADGYGIHIWKNGDKYEGEWWQCLKHGQGTTTFANGDQYSGQYVRGQPHGYGEYKYVNGTQYKGYFANGKRHGRGYLSKNNGDEYQGEWYNDKKHGYGVFKWPSGNIYSGEFRRDHRWGKGKMQWKDGSVYNGEWVKGIQHGYGEMTLPDGTKRWGFFDKNVYKGAYSKSVSPMRGRTVLGNHSDSEDDISSSRRQLNASTMQNQSAFLPSIRRQVKRKVKTNSPSPAKPKTFRAKSTQRGMKRTPSKPLRMPWIPSGSRSRFGYAELEAHLNHLFGSYDQSVFYPIGDGGKFGSGAIGPNSIGF